MARNNKDNKVEILKQSRDRTPMPRPLAFKSHKTYDRNAEKEEFREELDEGIEDVLEEETT